MGYVFGLCVAPPSHLLLSLFSLSLSKISELLLLSAPSISGACALIGIPLMRRRFPVPLPPVDIFSSIAVFLLPFLCVIPFDFDQCFARESLPEILVVFRRRFLCKIFRSWVHIICIACWFNSPLVPIYLIGFGV